MESSRQMSESVRIGIFLTMAGGFMDAYSYICRGKVFANAQTGNIVLLGQSLAEANFHDALKYILPIISFALGVYLCQKIQLTYKYRQRIHWRQIVLALEILFVIIIGFLSKDYDSPANMLISFVCGMQIIAFNKFHGNAYATTMCTGNLKSATTLLCIPGHRRRGSSYKEPLLLPFYLCFCPWCSHWCPCDWSGRSKVYLVCSSSTLCGIFYAV